MCLVQKEIKPKYYRHKIFVPCGHCPACQQEKANRRTRRIINHDPDLKFDCLFVTLTYKNEFIPYVSKSELQAFSSGSIDKFHVYRDNKVRSFYNRHSNKLYRVSEHRQVLETYTMQDLFDSNISGGCLIFDLNFNYKTIRSSGNALRKSDPDKVGVCYYKDIQNFNKRLRKYIFIDSRFPNDFKYSFFACTEYGPTTFRPHCHLLLYIPKGYFTLFKCAVIKAWSFDSLARRKANVEIARSPSAYVSSYLNGSSDIRGLLQDFKPFKMRHVYSQHFGFGKKDFSFDEILEKFRRGNLTTIETVHVNGVPSSVALPVPKYVVNRFFPKFKGYSSLTRDEVFDIVLFPQKLNFYAFKTGQSKQEQARLYTKLCNLSTYGLSRFDFAIVYSSIWSLLASNVLRLSHDFVPIDEYFSNLDEYFLHCVVRTYVRNDFVSRYALLGNIDINLTPSNKRHHDYLITMYHNCNKERKARNALYADYNF